MVKSLKDFPRDQEQDKDFLTTPIQHCTGSPSLFNMARKRKHTDWKGNKTVLILDSVIAYVKASMEFTRNTHRTYK